ncbi:MAG: hypothetical protein K2X39_05670, partial [Silvanigrellaceae bacterium]|nr:hypothetical protein [Silvanigrellaceae bacterium]
NGSSKSSTADVIASALEDYSKSDEGFVFRFNWIFPNDKVGFEGLGDSTFSKHIGFGDKVPGKNSTLTFAHLSDNEIMCKIVSEMKENPIYLLPAKTRIEFFKQAFVRSNSREPSPEEIPLHFAEGALSAKNKKIFDSLLLAYKGNLQKVLRHVQIERFFFSSRYRVGVATVEPQVAIDAQERQLTVERSIQNIPTVLQNIRLFEPQGELIDANRGFIEFSDLLKRPLEAFKYLLTTIERMSISLPSGIADLDLIMLASTNEKHLDAFKNSPDWPSFKGRFELVRIPYLLSALKEQKIYEEDIRIISRTKTISPHAVDCLAKWAVLTRLRQPDPEMYDQSVRSAIAKLDPYEKLALYDGGELSEIFSEYEKSVIKKISNEIMKESQSSIAYEGRFGASPREMKMLLYFAANNSRRDSLSPLAIFEEIDKLTRDRTVYDYLQFEPRGGYHDYRDFLKYIKISFAKTFQREFLAALNFYDEEQYSLALKKYLHHVTSYLNKERIQNEVTGRLEEPNENF